MAKRQQKDEMSFILSYKNLNHNAFETTYKSSYGRFSPEELRQANTNFNFYKKGVSGCLTNMRYYNYKTNNNNSENFLKGGEEKNNKNLEKTKLMCPTCINENIIKAKSMNKIKRRVYETDGDIKIGENRTVKTNKRFLKNRDRSAQPYKRMTSKYNNDNNNNDSYFGNDVEYGMLRCRKRELQNAQKLFGLNSLEMKEKNNTQNSYRYLKNNKSWVGPWNYLLNKNEYSYIINKQMEKSSTKSKNEKLEKIKEENNLLNEQLKKEKDDINKEILTKNKRRNEMNKTNYNMIKTKKFEEYRKKRIQKQEKECLSILSKKHLEETKKKLRQKKQNNFNFYKINLKMFEDKILKNKKNKKNKIILNRNYEGLVLKGVEKENCEKCNRPYPKNVLSQMYFTYNDKQKGDKNKI